jgi:hypothetical protein
MDHSNFIPIIQDIEIPSVDVLEYFQEQRGQTQGLKVAHELSPIYRVIRSLKINESYKQRPPQTLSCMDTVTE